MKIVVVAKLSNEKLISKLQPIVNLPSVENIFVIRDFPGPEFNKVEYCIPRKLFGNFPVLSIIRKTITLFSVIKNHHPNFIVSYHLYPHGYIAFIANRISGIKFIHFIIAGVREIPLFGKYIRKINIGLLNSCDLVAVMGNATRLQLIEDGIPEKKIGIIPNSIDINKFTRQDFEKKFDIVILTRFYNIKRIDRCLSIMKKLSTHDPNVKMAIFGDGPLKSDMIKLSEDLNLNRNVFFHEMVEPEEINSSWNLGKIFILTSDGEGIPASLLEAMACGLCCIAPKIGEIDSVIEHGVNGFIVDDPNDIDTYVDFVIELLNDKKLFMNMSSNAINSIRGNYSYETATKSWELLLEKVSN